MKKQTKHQEPMIGLEDLTAHPMWAMPGDDEDLHRNTRLLRRAIARGLVPFDGAKEAGVSYDMPEVVAFMERIYKISTVDHSTIWLWGAITFERLQTVGNIDDRLAGMTQAWRDELSLKGKASTREHMARLRRQRGVIEEQAERLIQSIYAHEKGN